MTLTPRDDLIGHTCAEPFDAPLNDSLMARKTFEHSLFTERYWYSAHPIDGSPIIIDLGLGYYPQRGVMDAFAGITVGRQQHNFRATRQLGATPLLTTVGPLQFEVLEGLKRHRISLGLNDSGFSFELEFEASFPAAREKQSFRERDGDVQEDLARVAQFGRFSGWYLLDGKRYSVDRKTWWGQRDHSWGIRSEMHTDVAKPPVQNHSKFFWTWSMFQFENVGVSIFMKEREAGKPYYLSGTEYEHLADGRTKEREVVKASHDIVWVDDPLGQTIASADFHLEFDQGPPRDLHMEGQRARYYLKAGLYGGFKGWNHGDDKGSYYCEHDVWNLDLPETRTLARTLSDHVVNVTSAGMTGIGISEYGVAVGYGRYQIAHGHPAL
jgi:hypothetical protein